MDTLTKQKTFKKLGFAHLETAEIVSKLNILLANYQVFFHKLQNYHWNVVGSDFYDIHEITESMYMNALKNVDEIAERVRVFGKIPAYKMTEYLSESTIKETTHDMSADYMLKEITKDLEILSGFIIESHEISSKNGDISSSHLMSRIMNDLEKSHWQLSSWNNRKFK